MPAQPAQRGSKFARRRMGLPSYTIGVDCSSPDPGRWEWITTDAEMPSDARHGEKPWLPEDHPQRGLTRS